jgi:hypothetical protein
MQQRLARVRNAKSSVCPGQRYPAIDQDSFEMGAVTIPKSIHRDRMIENATVFDFALDADDLTRLAALYDNTRVAWDPRDF